MRKCRNWQTSKTKDLVIIAIVWVQVPSSALNNKTGIKQSVWSLSYCSKPKRALNPWFKVSPPARSARGMRSGGPHSPHLPQGFGCCVAGAPWVQGLRFASVVAEQTSPGRLAVSAPLRSLQNRRPPDVLQPIFRMAPIVVGQVPMVQGLASGSWHEIPRTSLGLRSASVVAEQTSPRTSCNPSSAWLRLLWGRRTIGPRSRLCTPSSALKWGKLNYTDFVQNCILDQKERTSL